MVLRDHSVHNFSTMVARLAYGAWLAGSRRAEPALKGRLLRNARLVSYQFCLSRYLRSIWTTLNLNLSITQSRLRYWFSRYSKRRRIGMGIMSVPVCPKKGNL